MRHHPPILKTLGVIAALVLLPAATALAAPVSSTVLVDRPAGFGALPFDGVSGASVGRHALSADGRYLVFSSSNDVLLAGDEDSAENVYRLDRSNGSIVQVNVTAAGGQPVAELSQRRGVGQRRRPLRRVRVRVEQPRPWRTG